ncbi:TA2R7 protein, partial [Serilophus lunatus]|nr:TA2R7 protein [Serilophus lunatus]
EQSNVTSFGATIVAIITLEAFAGMWINAFLVSVICFTWFKTKTLNLNEKILLLLGCSRFCYLCISWLYSFLSVIYPKYICVQPIFPLVLSIQTLLNDSSLWVSASLCVFYCIKIANFRNSFFIYLKVNINRIVPWLLLGIVPWLLLGLVLLSMVISILAYNYIDKALCKNFNDTCQECIWKASIRTEGHSNPIHFINGFVFVASFMAVIFSALLLLFSLWRHRRNMQTNSMNDLSVDAHIRAMKSILSFLLMYSINFILLILALTYGIMTPNHVKFPVYVFLYAFPGVHSLILIFSNPKLEKNMLRILTCMKCKDCMR